MWPGIGRAVKAPNAQFIHCIHADGATLQVEGQASRPHDANWLHYLFEKWRGGARPAGAQRAQLSLAASSEHVKAPAFRARSARS